MQIIIKDTHSNVLAQLNSVSLFFPCLGFIFACCLQICQNLYKLTRRDLDTFYFLTNQDMHTVSILWYLYISIFSLCFLNVLFFSSLKLDEVALRAKKYKKIFLQRFFFFYIQLQLLFFNLYPNIFLFLPGSYK